MLRKTVPIQIDVINSYFIFLTHHRNFYLYPGIALAIKNTDPAIDVFQSIAVQIRVVKSLISLYIPYPWLRTFYNKESYNTSRLPFSLQHLADLLHIIAPHLLLRRDHLLYL